MTVDMSPPNNNTGAGGPPQNARARGGSTQASNPPAPPLARFTAQTMVYGNYRDYAMLTEAEEMELVGITQQTVTTPSGYLMQYSSSCALRPSFPAKLHYMLEVTEQSDLGSVVSWEWHGR